MDSGGGAELFVGIGEVGKRGGVAAGKLKVAMSCQVEKNREAYAPMLNAEAERALATAARRRNSVAPDGAGAARLEQGVGEARRTVEGADGAGATITVADGTILDAVAARERS